jgi:hypothetical protein
MSDWRPIETAPKDELIVLAAWCVPSAAALRNGSVPSWTFGAGRYLWGEQWSGILGLRADYWMPLPPPPGDEA